MFIKFKKATNLIFALLLMSGLFWPLGGKNVAVYADGEPEAMDIIAEADSYVRADSPTTNFGNSSSLLAQNGIGSTSPFPVFSYLRFQLPEYDPEQVILYIYNKGINNESFDVYFVSDSTWSEYSITYQNKPSLGDGIASGVIPAMSWIGINVTDYVVANDTVSFAIAHNGASVLELSSREVVDEEPFLRVNPVTPIKCDIICPP